MVQHVNGPTHNCGNTLDLIITPSSCLLNYSVDVEPAGRTILRSLARRLQLPLAVETPSAVERLVRGWRRVDRKAVKRMLDNSELSRPLPDDVDDVEQLFMTYEAVLRNVADNLAPPITVRRKPNLSVP